MDAVREAQNDTAHRSREEIHHHYNPNGYSDRSTLNDAAEKRGQLAYVILYYDANPRWDTDRLIFVKSNLTFLNPEVLPTSSADNADENAMLMTAAQSVETQELTTPAGDLSSSSEPDVSVPEISSDAPNTKLAISASGGIESSAMLADSDPIIRSIPEIAPTDSSPSYPTDPQQPIAVYRQMWPKMTDRSIQFDAWYLIKRIQYLEPRSPELVRMLEQKWAVSDQKGGLQYRERNPKSWEESLGSRWAVIQWERCIEQVPGPEIELLAGESGGGGAGWGYKSRKGGYGRARGSGGRRGGRGGGSWWTKGGSNRQNEISREDDNRKENRDDHEKPTSAKIPPIQGPEDGTQEDGGVMLQEAVKEMEKLDLTE